MLEGAKIMAGIVINDDVFARETIDSVKHFRDIFISKLLRRPLQYTAQNTVKPFSFESRTRLG